MNELLSKRSRLPEFQFDLGLMPQKIFVINLGMIFVQGFVVLCCTLKVFGEKWV